MKKKVVLFTGVPGVGTSTIIKTMQKRGKIPFTFINFGDIMLNLGTSKGYVKDRDHIRKLPVRRQKELQLLSAVDIQERSSELYLVDTHCTVKTPDGYLPGFPKAVLDQLSPDAIIVVEANPKEVLERRSLDKARKRDEDTEEKISEHQAINRMAAITYATFVGAPVLMIQNPHGKLDETATTVERVLTNVMES